MAKNTEIGNQINSLIKMLKNQRHQNEIDSIGTPEINNLFDYEDGRITRLQQNIIERRRQEMRVEKEAKERYGNDLKRIEFLKFLKRNKDSSQGLNISEEQFEILQERFVSFGIENDHLREMREKLMNEDLTELELLKLKQDIAISMLNTIQVTG